MSAKYRTLIWEQRRVAGVVVVAAYFMGLAVQLTYLMLHPSGKVLRAIRDAYAGIIRGIEPLDAYVYGLPLDDVQAICIDFGEAMAILAACALCFRLDAAGNFAYRFDGRLLRLPVRTIPLMLTQFWTRVALLIVLRLAQWLTYGFMFGDFTWWWWLLLPVEFYVFGQAIVWSAGHIRGLSYAMVALILGMFVCIRIGDANFADSLSRRLPLMPGSLGFLHQGVRALPHALTSPLGFAGFLGVFTALALWAVSLCRRDEQVGPSEPDELGTRLVGRREATGFATRNDALAWYAWRTAAWTMAPATISISLSMLAINAIFMDRAADLWISLVPGPYVAFGLAVLSASVVAVFSEGNGGMFVLRTPVASAQMAHAKLCANFKGIAISLTIAVVWSTAGMFLTMRPLLDLLREIGAVPGMLSGWNMAALFLSPVALIGFLSLGLMIDAGGRVGNRIIGLGLLMYLFLPLALTVCLSAVLSPMDNKSVTMAYWLALSATHLTMLTVAALLATWRRLLQPKRTVALCAVWAGATSLFWLSGGEYGTSVPGLPAVAALCSLPFVPFVWTPLTIHMARHR